MLVLTERQFRCFADAQVENFIRQSAKALQASFPAEAAGLGEAALLAYVGKTVGQLRAIGFEYTGGIERALSLLFPLQHGARPRRLPDDLARAFKDPSTSIEKKLEALEQVFIFDEPPPPAGPGQSSS